MRKRLILGSCSLVLLGLVLTSLARAGDEEAEAIIWVADTRNLTGIWKWFAAMYNEAPLKHALLVIVITAVADALQKRRTLHMGANKYIIKPVSAKSLAKTIASILHESGRRHAIQKSTSTSY